MLVSSSVLMDKEKSESSVLVKTYIDNLDQLIMAIHGKGYPDIITRENNNLVDRLKRIFVHPGILHRNRTLELSDLS